MSMSGKLQQMLQKVRLIIRCGNDTRVSRSAAAASYYALFMLFPMVITLALLASHFNDSEEIVSKLQNFLPAQLQDGIIAYFEYATGIHSTSFIVLTGIFSVFFSYRLVDYINFNLSVIYTPQRIPRLAVRLPRVLPITLILICSVPILFLTISFRNSTMMTVKEILNLDGRVVYIWRLLRFPLAALIMYLLIVLFYRFSTYYNMSAGDVRIGAVVAFSMWLAITLGFSWYLNTIGDYYFLYGAFGTVIALMFWLYFTAYSLFFGAAINVLIKNHSI